MQIKFHTIAVSDGWLLQLKDGEFKYNKNFFILQKPDLRKKNLSKNPKFSIRFS